LPSSSAWQWSLRAQLVRARHVHAQIAHAHDQALELRLGSERVELVHERARLQAGPAATAKQHRHGIEHLELADAAFEGQHAQVRRVGVVVGRLLGRVVRSGFVELLAEHRGEGIASEAGKRVARFLLLVLVFVLVRGFVFGLGLALVLTAGERTRQQGDDEDERRLAHDLETWTELDTSKGPVAKRFGLA
jgi:hypothetical protein